MRRGTERRPIRLSGAIAGIRELIKNPDDTSQVFLIIRSLTGDSFERIYQRTLASPGGAPFLCGRPPLIKTLEDREALLALPENSLGHHYARFMAAEKISADGLVAASEDTDNPSIFLDPRASVLSERLRDSHDLWHIVTGYGRDLIGEAGLLAFTFAQVRNPGIGFIVAVAALKLRNGGHRQAPRFIRQGYLRGKRASLLAAADWEALLPLPLDEVRQRLSIEPVEPYEEAFSDDALRARAAA